MSPHEDRPALTGELPLIHSSGFASIALMNFLSSSPSRVQATPLSCRSSVPKTSENARMVRRQFLDFNCACIKGTTEMCAALRKAAV